MKVNNEPARPPKPAGTKKSATDNKELHDQAVLIILIITLGYGYAWLRLGRVYFARQTSF